MKDRKSRATVFGSRESHPMNKFRFLKKRGHVGAGAPDFTFMGNAQKTLGIFLFVCSKSGPCVLVKCHRIKVCALGAPSFFCSSGNKTWVSVFKVLKNMRA